MRSKYKYKIVLIFISAILLLLPFSSVLSLTWVGGYESGTWISDFSPYIAQTDVIVAADQTLTINSDVEVQFQNDSKLTIFGRLRVLGSYGHPVVFRNFEEGILWEGIQIISSNIFTQNEIRYAKLRDCRTGIQSIHSFLVLMDSQIDLSVPQAVNNIWSLRFEDRSTLIMDNLATTVTTIISNARVLSGFNSTIEITDSEFTLNVEKTVGGNEDGAILDLSSCDGIIEFCHLRGTAKNTDLMGIIVNNGSNLRLTHNSVRLESEANTISDAIKITHSPSFLIDHFSIDFKPLDITTLMYGIEAVSNTDIELVNCIINNSVKGKQVNCLAAVVGNNDSRIYITHCDMYNTEIPQNAFIEVDEGSIIWDDPLWVVDNLYQEYHLQPNSPCIDAGIPINGSHDPDLTPPDIGMYYYPQSAVDEPYSPRLPPAEFRMNPAYPNPFNSSAQFEVLLPARSQLKIEVYNLLGRRVAVLASDVYPPGVSEFSWNGLDLAGQPQSSGIYLIQAESEEHSSAQRIYLIH